MHDWNTQRTGEKRTEKSFEEMMDRNSQNLRKARRLQIQESQQTASARDECNFTIIIRLLKISDRDKIFTSPRGKKHVLSRGERSE